MSCAGEESQERSWGLSAVVLADDRHSNDPKAPRMQGCLEMCARAGVHVKWAQKEVLLGEVLLRSLEHPSWRAHM